METNLRHRCRFPLFLVGVHGSLPGRLVIKPLGSRFQLDMDVNFRQRCGVPPVLVGVVSRLGRLAVTLLLKVPV